MQVLAIKARDINAIDSAAHVHTCGIAQILLTVFAPMPIKTIKPPNETIFKNA